MADNVPITAGSGTTIATDDISNVHYQRVKLVDGTLDGTAPLGGVDDTGFTPAMSCVMPAGCFVDDTSTDIADEGDMGIARMTADRKQIVALGESGVNFVRGGGNKTDTSDQSVMAASGFASVFNYLCFVTGYNSSATNTYVNVKDGSTIVAVIPLPAYGGFAVSFPTPIRGSGNTAFNLATGASVTTASLYGGGYKGA